MAYNNSKIYVYTGGTWVEILPIVGNTHGWVEFNLDDTLYLPQQLEIVIADPNHTEQIVFTPFIPVRLVEKQTQDKLFEGYVTYVEPEMHPAMGPILKVTVQDYLYSLTEQRADIDLSGKAAFPVAWVVIPLAIGGGFGSFAWLLDDYGYNRLTYTNKIGGNFTPGNWIIGNFSGLIAEVQSEGSVGASTYITVQLGGPYDMTIGEVITENKLWPHGLFGLDDYPSFAPTGVTATAGLTERKLYGDGLSCPWDNFEATEAPNYAGVGGTVLDELTALAHMDKQLDHAPPGETILSRGYHFFAVREVDFQQKVYYFHRGKWLGLNHALVPDNNGTDPPNPALDGLTLSYDDPDSAQVRHMADQYAFAPMYPAELVSRVVLHYSGLDQSAQIVTVRNAAVENAFTCPKVKHVYNYRNMNSVDAEAEATNILNQISFSTGIMRGMCNVVGYPMYTRTASEFFVRAGCLVHIHNSKIPAVDGTNMIITKLSYHEPSCVAMIELVDAVRGLD